MCRQGQGRPAGEMRQGGKWGREGQRAAAPSCSTGHRQPGMAPGAAELCEPRRQHCVPTPRAPAHVLWGGWQTLPLQVLQVKPEMFSRRRIKTSV